MGLERYKNYNPLSKKHQIEVNRILVTFCHKERKLFLRVVLEKHEIKYIFSFSHEFFAFAFCRIILIYVYFLRLSKYN